MADTPDEPRHDQGERTARRGKPLDPRARFARAIARAELGRAYWGDETEEYFREAKRRKPPKSKNGKC